MLRFSLNGAGEVGTAGLPRTQSEDERSPARNDIKGTTSWFRSSESGTRRSVPEMGFYVQERRFGFYQRQKDTGRVRATVRHLPAEDVPRFIEDLREYAGEEEITFHVDDRELDERIGPVLLESGCTSDVAEVFLAHTGRMPLLASESEDLSVEAVSEGTIEEAMRTERKAFADSEAEPDPEELRRRLALRRAEMGGQGRFLLARVGGEPASSWPSTRERTASSTTSRRACRLEDGASRGGCSLRSSRARANAGAARPS